MYIHVQAGWSMRGFSMSQQHAKNFVQHAKIWCNMLKFLWNILENTQQSYEAPCQKLHLVTIFMIFILGLQLICGQMFKI